MNSLSDALWRSAFSPLTTWQCALGRMLMAVLVFLVCYRGASIAQESCPPIERRLPAPGKVEPSTEDVQRWESKMQELSTQLAGGGEIRNIADAGVLIKAVQLAIRFGEFYRASDFRKVDRVLDLASERVDQASQANAVTVGRSGLQVRGFRSKIDGSFQPVGLELPNDLQNRKNVPLVVWLHGRGDSKTDLHFICERLDKPGQIKMPEAIILHPFGRQCVGYKSAGETDVLEAIDFVCEQYPVDPKRIVLIGFSMGGAGVWHLAAHHTDRFIAASPGAGFAETARYQRLTPEKFPPKYEQILWSVYDVTGYVRNLFNIPVVAYSGENDKQIQAARVMEEAYREHERTLPHLIGPGMGHKYHPDTLAEITSRMRETLDGEHPAPSQLFLQTRHLRYATRGWIKVTSQFEQYADTRVDAVLASGTWELATKNVSRLSLSVDERSGPGAADSVRVDEQEFTLGGDGLHLVRAGVTSPWQEVARFDGLFKQPGLSGPIDDAFYEPFLVVTPDALEAAGGPQARWVACELANFQQRWEALFRGAARVKSASEVTAADLEDYHLVCWGTPESNLVIGRVFTEWQKLAASGKDRPIKWTEGKIRVGAEEFDGAEHILAGIYPNPLNDAKYVVLNSGVTFRQAHDRTNSLQNPHLPDWAIIGLDQPPTAELPGRIVRTGFFDENWGYRREQSW